MENTKELVTRVFSQIGFEIQGDKNWISIACGRRVAEHFCSEFWPAYDAPPLSEKRLCEEWEAQQEAFMVACGFDGQLTPEGAQA